MKIKRYILTISSRLRTCEDQDYEMEILFSVQSAMAMLKKYNTIMRSYGLYGSQPCTPLLSTGLSANEGLDPAVLPSHWPSPPAVQKSPPRPWGRDANILSLWHTSEIRHRRRLGPPRCRRWAGAEREGLAVKSKAVSPISSGFPELAPDPEQLEFFSQISSVFLWKAPEKPVFYSPMVADVEITHARSTTKSQKQKQCIWSELRLLMKVRH